jgi:hypothetical protein
MNEIFGISVTEAGYKKITRTKGEKTCKKVLWLLRYCMLLLLT